MTLMHKVTAATPSPETIAAAADAAGRRIAPLWPLSSFVAVNPFLGLTGQGVDAAMVEIGRSAGARMTLTLADYVAAIDTGRIAPEDLDAAVAAMPDVAPTGAALAQLARKAEDVAPTALPTLADLAGRSTGRDWPGIVTEQVAGFAAARFDKGQALLSLPETGDLWSTWKDAAGHDLSAGLLGLADARARIAAMPETAAAMIHWAVEDLGLPEAALTPYFTRLLYTVSGWAGHARYRLWQAELKGGSDDALTGLLAVRLAWEVLLKPLAPAAGWAEALAAHAAMPAPGKAERLRLALQTAYEAGWQRQAFAQLGQTEPAAAPARPEVQAAFCIDVRSEVFRRAFETAMPGAETIGFAGFFGAALAYRPLGAAAETARCPVLLSPSGTMCDHGPAALAETRAARIAGGSIWARFQGAAIAGFGFVETLGLGYVPGLVRKSLGLTTRIDPDHAALTGAERAELAPSLDAIPAEARGATAATILKAMSLTGPFARIVVLAGHGGQSLNNPHAAGLDCGACGGHTGEANARLVAALLNDAEARQALPGHGIELPEDTVFVAALHDTTTDEVTLFDTAPHAATHAADLAALRQGLAAAGRIARAERAALLNLDGTQPVDAAIALRARDWSQVRPEWALAGCAAFIAAPRHRSTGADLGGRAFLHSYDWQADEGYGVLELILTAPLVVASWINLQYYGSTVDNRAFGAGNKVLHNVSGLVGVLEGTGGDLRPGLPWQSVHDGERLIHEPLRLSAVIEAPTEAMDAIIARHEGLRDLLDNGWVHLFQMDASGRVALRYAGLGRWLPVEAAPAREAARAVA